MMLTPHFARREFTDSQTAVRHGIDNEPPPEAWENLHALAVEVLEPVRAAFGPIKISSGYRSFDLNVLVRGSRRSQHLLGEAADVIPYRATTGALLRFIAEHLPFDQLIWEFGGAWVHVSHKREGPQRGEVLEAVAGPSGPVYLPLHAERLKAL